MTISTTGQYETDSLDFLLDTMMADAKAVLGNDLNDDQLAVIRLFYTPIAERLISTQEDIGEVLASSQIKYAEGTALDLLVERVGVYRVPAKTATGEAVFSRSTAASTDYTIPEGTIIKTGGYNSVEFATTEAAVLLSGETSVTVPIAAVEGGVEGNVGANAIQTFGDQPTGIEEVTNPQATSGGAAAESDEALRERALAELNQSRSATPGAILGAVRSMGGVNSASIFLNNTGTDNSGSGGLADHAFEVVVDGTATDADVAQVILDKMAAGATPFGGAHGSATTAVGTLINGQSVDVTFSRANRTVIYVEADLEVTADYIGNAAVEDSVIGYLGGTRNDGTEAQGQVGLGSEVLIGEIEYQIRDVQGVYDVTSLRIKKGSSGTWTTVNIQMPDDERPVGNATDGSMTVTSTTV